MIYERNCPICDKLLKYGSSTSWNLAKRRNARCRNCSTKEYAKRNGDASFLLDETNESFYWIGFILADGTLDKRSRLTIILSEKDKQHLDKLSHKFGISCKNMKSKLGDKEYAQVKLSIMHTEIFKTLIQKFNIRCDKTHNPPNVKVFDHFTDGQLFSLFVGFIDGDGNIGKKYQRNDFQIRIKCHSSWIDFIKYFNNKLSINAPIKINKQGYCLYQITDYKVCKDIKNRMIQLNIPYLKRKWNIINLNYCGKNLDNRKKTPIFTKN